MPGISSPIVVPQVLDRTGTLLNSSQVVSTQPIGRLIDTKHIFDICDDRAEQIVRSAGDKLIYVFLHGNGKKQNAQMLN